jgi:hypothetical protein
MKRLALLLTLALPLAAAEPIQLFDGKTLEGWVSDVPKADTEPNLPASFIIREGNLVSLGNPRGHLISEKEFSNYKLVVEYRFSAEPGNCGVLVHTTTPRYRSNMFPKSIEVQMSSGDAGDFWCIGENIEVPDMEKRRPRNNENQKFGGEQNDARRIINLTDGSEKPVGEWNTMEIICKGAEVIVHVNGTLVNHGSKSTATSGKIALQAEGSEVEFRKLELTPLP